MYIKDDLAERRTRKSFSAFQCANHSVSSMFLYTILISFLVLFRVVKRLLADSLAPPFHNPHIRRIDDVDRENYDVDIEQTMDDFAVTQTLPMSTIESERVELTGPETGLETG